MGKHIHIHVGVKDSSSTEIAFKEVAQLLNVLSQRANRLKEQGKSENLTAMIKHLRAADRA